MGHGWLLYSSTFCFSPEPSPGGSGSSSSPHPPGGCPPREQTQDDPMQETFTVALPVAPREATLSWLHRKVEIQPTSPALDVPDMSQLPQAYLLPNYGGHSIVFSRYALLTRSFVLLSFNFYFLEAR